MPWATRRQLMYAAIVVVVLLVIVGTTIFSFVYTPSSCTDGVLNQNEEGIDCGGICSKLCQAPRVSALWARSVRVAPGVYHAVAMVKNPESDAGTEYLPYTFSLYDAENVLVAERDGTMILDPGEVVPLFEPNVITGERVPVRTFVTFDQALWRHVDRVQNPVTVDSEILDQNTLQLSARVLNTTPLVVPKVTLTALLYDTADMLVAASQTVLINFPARGQQQVVFTWQEPFTNLVARFVITPRLH